MNWLYIFGGYHEQICTIKIRRLIYSDLYEPLEIYRMIPSCLKKHVDRKKVLDLHKGLDFQIFSEIVPYLVNEIKTGEKN